MRNGDFSELLNPANPYYRAVRLIRDPLTGLPCTAADQRGCFQGNIIPRDRISPNGLALLNSYPLPTPGFQQGTNNWIGTPATFDDTRKDSIKIDFVPVSNHRIAVRQTWAPHVWNDPESATAFSSIWDYPGQTGAATYTGTLSSSLINEASFSWGSTKPSRFFGQRNCDYCPGGTESRAVSDALVDRLELSVPVPGHEARSREAVEPGDSKLQHADAQPVSGLLVRLRVPVVRQRHEDHRQSHVQGRRVGGTLRHEGPDSAQRRIGAGDHESERLVPLH